MSKVTKLVLAGMLLAQTVAAQPDPSPPPATDPTTAPSQPGAPGAEVDISVPHRSTLRPQEMVAQARDYRARASEVLVRIESLQERARKEKDIIRLNCLTDKLQQAKVNLNIADQAIVNLEDAIRRQDDGASLHEFTRVTLVHQKAQVLGAEAEQCVGEDLTFVGDTRVDVEIDPGVRQDDPTAAGLPVLPVDRPPSASPFM
jgi:hypothetical protein